VIGGQLPEPALPPKQGDEDGAPALPDECGSSGGDGETDWVSSRERTASPSTRAEALGRDDTSVASGQRRESPRSG